MLPRTHRLSEDKAFARLFKTGRSAFGRALAIKFLPNAVGTARFGFIVSTKISKRAVVRNRIKRRLRGIVYGLLPRIAESFDIAVTARPGAVDAGFDELRTELEALLARQRLLKRP